jgi:hypothetical protein
MHQREVAALAVLGAKGSAVVLGEDGISEFA